MRRVFIVSDLHLGGRPGSLPSESGQTQPRTQMCSSYGHLTNFIDWVRTSGGVGYGTAGQADDAELIINGDIVDFLADDEYPGGESAHVFTSDQDVAIKKLAHIFARTGNRDGRTVLDALRDLLRSGQSLTILLGNHDVELALPRVRQYLVEALGGQCPRLRLLYDGEALTLGRVLIEHGNRYDRWNQIDHSALRQERSVLSRGLLPSAGDRGKYYFIPPAGTHLVIHFMNRIKARYRFVDLLKPEDAAVLPLLIALEPHFWPALRDLVAAVPIGQSFAEHGLRDAVTPRVPGDLSDDARGVSLDGVLRETLGASAVLFEQLGPALDSMAGDLAADDGDGLLYDLRRWFCGALTPLQATLDSVSTLLAVRSAPSDDERRRRLHAALAALRRDDNSFNPSVDGTQYEAAASQLALSGNFDVVVFGHTHLPRSIKKALPSGRDYHYINTGTWADVMHIPAKLTGHFEHDADALLAFEGALRKNDLGSWATRYLSYAEIDLDGDDVSASALRSYGGPGRERCPPLTSMDDLP